MEHSKTHEYLMPRLSCESRLDWYCKVRLSEMHQTLLLFVAWLINTVADYFQIFSIIAAL